MSYLKHRIALLVLCVVFLSIFAGCGGSQIDSRTFLRENTDMRLIERVAVMPFVGTARAEYIRDLAITELLSSQVFEVVDKGRVDIVLKREGLGNQLDVFTIRRLGESLKVQALLFGTVEQTTMSRGSSSFPELTLTLRLIDCESGQLLWQASGRGSGYSVADRLFGFAPKDIFEITLELLDSLYATMY